MRDSAPDDNGVAQASFIDEAANSGPGGAMFDSEQLAILRQSVAAWNSWRHENYDVQPNLAGADLSGLSLSAADLREADLRGANMRGAELVNAELSEADLTEADLEQANLSEANLNRAVARRASFVKGRLNDALLAEAVLERADLRRAALIDAKLQHADLTRANLDGAALSRAWLWDTRLYGASLVNSRLDSAYLGGARFDGADLTGAKLTGAQILHTSFRWATLVDCNVHGAAVWGANTSHAHQRNLVITNPLAPRVTVGDLKIAQFMFLLLDSPEVSNIIDSMTTKIVLILGRFTDDRLTALQAIDEALRARDLVPVLFTFPGPESKDDTGTVETLARIAQFVVADLTDPRSVPHELATIVPFLRTTPILPIQLTGAAEYSMFGDLMAYPWVLNVHRYGNQEDLLASLDAWLDEAKQVFDELHPNQEESERRER